MAHPVLHPETIAALSAAIGSVPGCTIDRRNCLDGRSAVATATHIVVFSGWSPSLHEVDVAASIAIAKGLPAEAQTAEVLAALEPVLAVQRRRATAGLALTHPTPYPLSFAGYDLIDLGHLHADASALAILIDHSDDHRCTRSPMPDARQAARLEEERLNTQAARRMAPLRTPLHDLHAYSRRYDGGPSMRRGGERVSEHGDMRVLAWDQAVHTPSLPGRTAQGTLKGATLTIDRTIDMPDTLLHALAGRRVADLVDIGPWLSDRRIRRARRLASGEVSATLEPLLVPISSVQNLTTGQALDHLRDIIRSAAHR